MAIKESQSSWIVLFTKHGPINRHPYFAIFREVSVNLEKIEIFYCWSNVTENKKIVWK